jgi:hypothetical protein
MELALIALVLLAVSGVVATVLTTVRDGHSRVPTRTP